VTKPQQILACSGVLHPPSQAPTRHIGVQVRQAMRLSEAARPRVCLIPTGVGDNPEVIGTWYSRRPAYGEAELSHLALFPQPNLPDIREHLLSQDVIFVSGGSVVNLLAVWRAHRLDAILRECWEAGVVLAGQSAGSLCWHLGGITDSFSDRLDPFDNGLGFLPYSNGAHDDLPGQPRRRRLREAITSGRLPHGYATEDGVALHYIDTRFHQALSVLEHKRAWHITTTGDTVIQPRHWIPPL
jgi:peptidase E